MKKRKTRTTYRKDLNSNNYYNFDYQDRSCLSCSGIFRSWGKQNRICNECKDYFVKHGIGSEFDYGVKQKASVYRISDIPLLSGGKSAN